jgi:predicted glycosyltransferase
MIDLNTCTSPAPRGMFYCHDTFGLGHLRRTMALANHVRATIPNVSQLIVTGSPSAHGFEFPSGTDYVKLPAVTKNTDGDYVARSLASSLESITEMRSDILLSAARHFEPDFFIVDHAPAGLDGEALATLRFLRDHRPQTKLIVGLRDIIDEAPKVRRSWARDGVYELLDDVYDLILVYGHRHIYDVVEEYGLSGMAASKTRFVGYLGRDQGSIAPEEVRAGLPMQTNNLVLVTAGGGGDGQDLFDTMVRGLVDAGDQVDFDCLLIGGPLMDEEDRSTLRRRIGDRKNLHFLDFADQMTSYLGAADVVVSMGGYNSLCEILSLGRPAIIVPRITPRKEQLIRAEILSQRGLVQIIHPDHLTPARLLDTTRQLLTGTRVAATPVSMEGLSNVVSVLRSLMPGLRLVPDAETIPMAASA